MQNSDIYPERKITRENINQALKEYLGKGGMIKVLPPQVHEVRSLIPTPFAAYEEMEDAIFGS